MTALRMIFDSEKLLQKAYKSVRAGLFYVILT